jgi:hypothetical protein
MVIILKIVPKKLIRIASRASSHHSTGLPYPWDLAPDELKQEGANKFQAKPQPQGGNLFGNKVGLRI